MTTIIIFCLSFFISTIFVVIKYFEIKKGNKNSMLGILNKLDDKALVFFHSTKFRSLQLIQTIRYIILVKVKELLIELFEKYKNRIIEEYRLRKNSILIGKKQIKNKGSVSFYLKKITEHKGNGERGKIEDRLDFEDDIS